MEATTKAQGMDALFRILLTCRAFLTAQVGDILVEACIQPWKVHFRLALQSWASRPLVNCHSQTMGWAYGVASMCFPVAMPTCE